MLESIVSIAGWTMIFLIIYLAGILLEVKISEVLWTKIHEYDHLPLNQIIWNRAILFPIFFPLSYGLSETEIVDKLTKYNFPRRKTLGWPLFFLVPTLVGMMQIPFAIVIPRIWDAIWKNQAYQIRCIRSAQAKQLKKLKRDFYHLDSWLKEAIEYLQTSSLPEKIEETKSEILVGLRTLKNKNTYLLGKGISECEDFCNMAITKIATGGSINADSEMKRPLSDLKKLKEALKKEALCVEQQLKTIQ